MPLLSFIVCYSLDSIWVTKGWVRLTNEFPSFIWVFTTEEEEEPNTCNEGKVRTCKNWRERVKSWGRRNEDKNTVSSFLWYFLSRLLRVKEHVFECVCSLSSSSFRRDIFRKWRKDQRTMLEKRVRGPFLIASVKDCEWSNFESERSGSIWVA
jgi:hypothetical protein